ncbi:MAG: hypothetical protein IT372_18590 [Polyangiaceae bacterium]|nr:hypothetical protein [Polyangiaceae bacterium]
MLKSSRLGLWTLATTVLSGAVLAASCSYYPYHCETYSECEGGDGDACPGQCVPLPPVDFDGPMLLWMGREMEAPGCPDPAPKKVYVGHAGLDASNECPPCECTQPACELPSSLTASDLSVCPNDGPGATLTSFDAPSSWTGACTSPTTVPASQLGSVTIPPVTVRPCEPVQEVPLSQPATWGQLAYACAGEAIPNVCATPGETCLPSAEPPPPGFRQCVLYSRDGDTDCPADFPEKHVFYRDVEDTRSCTACECTPTAAASCAASISIYEQPGCNQLILNAMVGMGGPPPSCHIVQPGTQLGSMQATMLPNEPGSCVASGGVATGEAKPLDARTFCCQPPPG